MEGTKLRVSRTGREAMAALARLRDGDAALLYAYAASRDGGCTPAQAAQALDFSPEQMEKASQLLLVYGLAVNHTAPPPRQGAAYPAAELAPNEYIGEADGFGGPIKVKVTMDGDKIAKIEVLSHKETAGIGTPAFDTIPERIIAAQSADVDVLTNATYSSKGLIEAVNDALAKARK